jgi:Zn-dependent protease with chaperone function
MSMKPWDLLYAGTVFCQLPAMAFRWGLGYIIAAAVEFVFHLPVVPWLCLFVFVVRRRAIMEDEGGRWLVGYIAVVVVGLIIGLPFEGMFYGFGLAIAPVVWSLSAFKYPGKGWWWHRKVGAREPSAEERTTLKTVVDALGPKVATSAREIEWYAISYPEPFLASRGCAVVVSTGLLKADPIEGPVGHEIGHVRSGDACLSQALDRLTPWDEVLVPSEDAYQRAGTVKRFMMDARCWFLRIAGGQVFFDFEWLQALWAKDFRRREVAADLFVVELDFGDSYAEYLEIYDEPRELPNPRGLFDYRHHPPTEHRISMLRAEAEALDEVERSN